MTKYNQVTPEIAAQLQAIVGAKRFFAGDAVKDDFSHDEMPIYGKYYPEVVCEAESTEEVSAILRVCYDNNIPVTPRGAGTGLVGGCVPLCGGVVLCAAGCTRPIRARRPRPWAATCPRTRAACAP